MSYSSKLPGSKSKKEESKLSSSIVDDLMAEDDDSDDDSGLDDDDQIDEDLANFYKKNGLTKYKEPSSTTKPTNTASASGRVVEESKISNFKKATDILKDVQT